MLFSSGAGIGISNDFNSIVKRNDITGSPNVPGILLRDGRDAKVDCNDIRSSSNGIEVDASIQNRYGANRFLGNDHDMLFIGDNMGASGSIIEWNTFNTSVSESLYYNFGAFTGAQEHTRYNVWIWPNGVEARHMSGSGSNVDNSSFWYPTNANPVTSLAFPRFPRV